MLSYKRVHLRMFLEDVEVSISSITVNTMTDTTAQITILPHKDMLHIKPGTNVSVFFKDINAEPAFTINVTDYGAFSESEKSLVDSYENYSLLFMGHIEHFNLSRQAVARNGVLQCRGDLSLLKRFQTYISNVNKDILNKNRNFVGASSFFSSNTGEHELVRQITKRFTTDNYPIHTPGFSGLQGPARGFISTIEHAMGVIDNQATRNQRKRGAQQDFFAIANLQSKLLYQIGAVDVDEAVNSLLKSSVTKTLLGKSANTTTGLMDLLTLLKKIMGKLYYKIYAVSTSRVILGDTIVDPSNDALEKATQIISTETLSVVINEIDKDVDHGTVINALWSDNIFNEFVDNGVSIDAGEENIVNILGSKRLIAALDECVEPFRSQVYDTLRVAFSDIFFNYINEEVRVPRSKLLELKSTLLTARTQIASSLSARANTLKEVEYFRVLNYLVLPEMFFATPPTCNVIFPNQISSFTYSADAFNKPTRLMLYTQKGVTGESRVSATSVNTTAYFAPSSEALVEFQRKTSLEKPLPLLKHEHHTGIVPIIKEISALETNRIRSTSESLDRDTIYLKLANFQLLQERFKDDTIQVTGPFNPFACPGFSCAIIDTDRNNIHHEPTVYLGLLQSVSHSISTNNASTNYSINYARTFDEVDELFEDSVLAINNSSHVPSPLHVSKTTTKNTLLVENETFNFEDLGSYLYGVLLNKIPSDSDLGESFYLYSTKKLIDAQDSKIDIDAGNNVAVTNVPILIPWFETNFSSLSEDASDTSLVKAVENIWKTNYINNNFGRLLWAMDLDKSRLSLVKNNYIKAYLHVLTKNNVTGSDLSNESSSLNTVIDSFINSSNVTVDGWTEYINKDTTLKYRKKYFKSDSWNIFNFYTPKNPSDILIRIIDENLVNSSSPVILSKYSTPQGISFDVFAVKDSLSSADGTPISQKTILAEELYRPAWYGDNFSVVNIGKEVYQKLIGSRSVQDYLEGSNTDKDSVVVNKLTNSVEDVYSTKKSILYAVDIYNKLVNSENKVRYVESYVRRPIANMADIVGPLGFITNKESDSVYVEDHSKNCGEAKVSRENEHVRDPVVDPNKVIAEKIHACNNYEVQTRKRVYR